MRIMATLTLALMTAPGLSGCWESTDVTLHEPGKYRGTEDPLLEPGATSRVETLRKRFELVQTDR